MRAVSGAGRVDGVTAPLTPEGYARARRVLMRRDPYRYNAGASGNNFVGWSPYEGIELPFRAIETYLRGECVATEGHVLAEPGQGRFVSPLRAQ